MSIIPDLEEAVYQSTTATQKAEALLALFQAQEVKDFRKWLLLSEEIEIEATELAEAKPSEAKILRAAAMKVQGICNHWIGNAEKAEKQFTAALEVYRELGNKLQQTSILRQLGLKRASVGKYAEAMELYQESLSLAREAGDKIGIFGVLNNIALVFLQCSDFSRALEYLEESLAGFREMNSKMAVASALFNIGLCYYEWKKYEIALDYFEQSIEIKKELDDEPAAAASLQGVAGVYRALNKPERALENAFIALEVYKKIGDTLAFGGTLVLIGNIYADMSDFDKASRYYEEALPLFRDIGSKNKEVNLLIYYGEMEIKRKNYDKAEEYLQQSLAMATEISLKKAQLRVYRLWAEYYEARELWMETAKNLKIFHDLEREIYHTGSDVRLQLYNILYKVAQKDLENEKLKLLSEQLEKEVKKQQQELTAKTLHIARQADIVERFRSDVREVMRHADTAEKAIRAVRSKLQDLPISALNWDEFENDFAMAHPKFKEHLLERFPDLTQMEVKVCLLMRVDMTSKSIANLLTLSERTIEHHRLSIRKKMKLDGKANVQRFLSDL